MKNNLKFKVIGLITVCLLTANLIQGQAEARFGIRAGVLISNRTFKQGGLDIHPKSKFGADVALVADFPMGVISFAPELHWAQKGYKIDDIGPIGNVTATFNYLELPFLVKVNFGGEDFKFFVMGGPSVGYLLSGKTEDDNGNTTNPDFDFINRLEFGAHLGAGISAGPLMVDVRYMLGITNFSKDIPDTEIKNNGLGAGVSLLF